MTVTSVLVIACIVALFGAIIVGIMRLATGKERAHRPVDGESVGSGMLGELIDVFQPSRTHLTEERVRQRADIAQRPSEGLPFGVDLDSGVAYLPGSENGTPPSAE